MAERWNHHLVRPFLVSVQRNLQNIPRYLLRYTTMILALYGLFGLWDVYGDGHIPLPLPLRGNNPLCHSACPAPPHN